MKTNHIKTLTTFSLIGHVLVVFGGIKELTIAKETKPMRKVG